MHISQAPKARSRQSCWLVFSLAIISGRATAFRTANAVEAEPVCSELISPNAVSMGDAPADGWYLISPLGNFPRPNPADGTQIFGLDQAKSVVSTFNSLTGKAGRYFKNMWHGLGAKATLPVFEGHADNDPKRWRTLNRLGEIDGLHADEQGLWGHVTWNAEGLRNRTAELGPLKPSPLFWHNPPDDQGRVFPEMLESVGLVCFPNIRTAPQWTANAAIPLAGPPAEPKANNNMKHREQLIALLGLTADATDAAIQSSLDQHSLKVTSTANALSTVTTEKTQLETKLTTANSQVTALTTERDQLKTANSGLTTERDTLKTANDSLVVGILDLAEKRGAITPAEREGFKTRLTTANTAADVLKELPARKAMNVERLELNGDRIDLSTANARASALQTAVQKRMKDEGIGYDEAFGKCMEDPKLKPLIDAMKPAAPAAA